MVAGGGNHLFTTLSTVKTAPKWSFSGRKEDKDTLMVPGPGAYTSVAPEMSKYSKSSRVVFGTSGRETLGKSNVPGPGQYAPKEANLTASPRFGFGTAKRDGIAGKTTTPGPGAYSMPNVIGYEGAKYSVTGRRDEKGGTMLTPGPGTYQPNDTQRAGNDKPPTWSFGTSPRSGMGGSKNTPGPGQYEMQSKVGGGPAFSMKARRDITNRHNITPGPGAHGGLYTQFGY